MANDMAKLQLMRSEQAIIDELIQRKKVGTLREDGFDKVCRRQTLDKPKVAAVEKMLGYPLPPLLKRMYCDVANGGFGESYGLIGLVVVPAMIPIVMYNNCCAIFANLMKMTRNGSGLKDCCLRFI